MPNHVLELEDGSRVVVADERNAHEIPPKDLYHYISMAQFVGKGNEIDLLDKFNAGLLDTKPMGRKTNN